MTDVFVELSETDEGADAEDALRSLLRWLREDKTLGGALRGGIAPAEPAAGHMGAGAFDILQLALGSGLSVAALVVSVLQWQSARTRAPALTLSRGGVKVEVTAEGARDPETLRRVVDLLDGQAAAVAPDGERDGGAA